MQGKLTDAAGQTVPATVDAVRERLTGDAFFWLDLEGLDAESSGLLLREFGFHPLAVEDAEHFGQRPRSTTSTASPTRAARSPAVSGDGGHLRGPRLLLRQARGERASGRRGIFDGVRRRAARHGRRRVIRGGVRALPDRRRAGRHLLPGAGPARRRIDALEDAILKQPTEAQLGELFAMKRTL